MRRSARLFTTASVIASLVCAGTAAYAATAGTGAYAATAGTAARAAAPPPAGWRIVAGFPLGSSVHEFAASGPDDAWAAETCQKPCKSANGVILRHWNGKSWQAEPQPAVAKHTGDDYPLLAMAPGSNDVWAVYSLYGGKSRASAVEWTGKSWGKATLFPGPPPSANPRTGPSGTVFTSVVAPAPGDVWAFGTADGEGTQYVAHYNGKTWSRVTPPGALRENDWTASARSASDIWAQTATHVGDVLEVSHWNGTRWGKPAQLAAPKGANVGYSVGIAVSGRSDVWGYGYTALGLKIPHTDWLSHFNGRSWSMVRNPYTLAGSIVSGPLGADGSGGLWIAAYPVGSTIQHLYHVSAAGHWLKLAIRAPKGTASIVLSGFAAIPGSTSLYAYGSAQASSGQTEGVILKYGA
ncbi:MAG TPA: hypothetical protein VMI73_29075 [Trebonia sp.]|nr:hypothetical protein [Trebonia sp.]